MIEIHKIINNKNNVIKNLKKRNIDATYAINKVYQLEFDRRDILKKIEDLRFNFNTLNKVKEKCDEDIEKCKTLKLDIKLKEEYLDRIKKDINNTLIKIPNVPTDDVKFGNKYEDNDILYVKNYDYTLPENPLKHWEIAEKYNIIDFELGTKITERGFPVYIDKGARLQRAVINFCLDEANKYGFKEHQVPILVNKDTVYATGQYPDKEGQMYHIEKDDLYLVPTAEVPLTNIYRDTLLEKEKLPILVTGYTPCFRREAGAYGKDTKGLNRLHQFDKIELVCITTQEDGYERLEILKDYIETLLDKLKLTYRVLKLCGYELGFGAAKAYDIETWCPVQEKWLEVVTVTNFDTFQANRLNCRYKDDGGKKLVHTLNGTGLALPRIIATILETYQTKDGVVIPEVLQDYTGFLFID